MPNEIVPLKHEFYAEISRAPNPTGRLYFDRTIGGDCHHRDSGCDAVARLE
jgi:hypothetical protein